MRIAGQPGASLIDDYTTFEKPHTQVIDQGNAISEEALKGAEGIEAPTNYAAGMLADYFDTAVTTRSLSKELAAGITVAMPR